MKVRDLLTILLKVSFLFILVRTFTLNFLEFFGAFGRLSDIKQIIFFVLYAIPIILLYVFLIVLTEKVIDFLNFKNELLDKEIKFNSLSLNKLTLMNSLLIFIGIFLFAYHLHELISQTYFYLKKIFDAEQYVFNREKWLVSFISVLISLFFIKFSQPIAKFLINKEDISPNE